MTAKRAVLVGAGSISNAWLPIIIQEKVELAGVVEIDPQIATAQLEKYKLELNVEKTKIVPFSRRAHDRGIEQGRFSFLGFTFYLGKSREGNITVKLKTNKKRMKEKLKGVNKWAKEIRNRYKLRFQDILEYF